MIFQIILGAAALYIYAAAPRYNGIKYMKDFLGRNYAHRGLKNNEGPAPENSLEAFRLAVESNYGIELDVQLTMDGVPVVFHDRSLHRACGLDRNVSEMRLEELKSLKLFKSNQTIPTLSDTLETINGVVPIIIELKVFEGNNLTVCEAAQRILDKYEGDYCVESFHPFAILWYKKNRPQIIRGQLSLDYMKERSHDLVLDLLLDNLLYNFLTKPNFIAYRHHDRRKISLLISKKIFRSCIVAYTVTDIEDFTKNKDFYDLQIFEGFIPD